MTRWQQVKMHLWTMLGEHGWPGMDRRQWWWRRSRIGYRTSKMPILMLFLPHVAVIVLLSLSLPLVTIAWLFGAQIESDAWLAAFVTAPMSVLGWLIIPVMMGHRATIIDTDSGTVSEWRGVSLPLMPIIPLMRRNHLLERFTALQITWEKSCGKTGGRSGRGTQDVFMLKLIGSGVPDVIVVETRRLFTMRRIAENLARRCNLPIRDRTDGETIVRQANELDLPLIETAPSGPVPNPPILPPTTTLVLPARDAQPWVATQARPPFSGWRALLLMVLCGTLTYVATIAQPQMEAWANKPTPPQQVERPSAHWQPPSLWPQRLARIGSPGLVLVQYAAGLAAIAALLSFSGRWFLRPFGWRITVDARGLCVDRYGLCGAVWPHRRRQALRDLEELRIDQCDPHWRLLAICDKRIIPIGSTFTQAEAVALRQELVLALRAAAAHR